MAAKPTKRGDQVNWIYGGPVLTVREFGQLDPREVQQIVCVWFSPDGHFHEKKFPIDELVPAGTP